MATVSLSINGRIYEVRCDDSQVDQVHARARDLDSRVQTLARQLGVQPEGRLLVMAGLMLADELAEAKGKLAQVNQDLAAVASGDVQLAREVERMAERIESIADRLEQA